MPLSQLGTTFPAGRARSFAPTELVTSILQHHLPSRGRNRSAPQLALNPNTRLRPMVRRPHHLLFLTCRNMLKEFLLLSHGDEEPNLLDTIHGDSPTTRIRVTQPLPSAPSNRTLPIKQPTIVRRCFCFAHGNLLMYTRVMNFLTLPTHSTRRMRHITSTGEQHLHYPSNIFIVT